MHSDRKPYDLRWAILVAAHVEEFRPAGAKLLRLAFGYSPEYPARLLLSSNAKWERWKSVVKAWDRHAREHADLPEQQLIRECVEMCLPEQLQLIARSKNGAGSALAREAG